MARKFQRHGKPAINFVNDRAGNIKVPLKKGCVVSLLPFHETSFSNHLHFDDEVKNQLAILFPPVFLSFFPLILLLFICCLFNSGAVYWHELSTSLKFIVRYDLSGQFRIYSYFWLVLGFMILL